MITQKYNLNMIPDTVPVSVGVSQYDKTSRTIIFSIYNGDVLFSIPSGSTAFVRGTKPDKTGFEYQCTINGSDISFDIEEQMTVLAGRFPVELRIINSGEILGTANFMLNVEASPLSDDTIISDTDMPLIQEASAAADRAEAAASKASSVLSSVVKTVNNVAPDSNGNVNVDDSNKMNLVASPTNNNILLTNASGQAIDSGKKLSDLQEKLTAGNGIDITNNTITNDFATLEDVDLNTINYYYVGYVGRGTNTPPKSAYTSGHFVSMCWTSSGYGIQLFQGYGEETIWYRVSKAGAFRERQILYSKIKRPTITFSTTRTDVRQHSAYYQEKDGIVTLLWAFNFLNFTASAGTTVVNLGSLKKDGETLFPLDYSRGLVFKEDSRNTPYGWMQISPDTGELVFRPYEAMSNVSVAAWCQWTFVLK